MLEILNVIMRFLTWGFATYRWRKRGEYFMLLLSIALWMDFLAALTQKQVLSDFGLNPNLASLIPLMSLMAVFEGILLIAASLSLRDRIKTLWGQFLLLACGIAGPTYVLLTVLLDASPLVITAFPVPFMGVSLMFLGYSLIKEEVGLKTVSTLFPVGAFLLGAINLTYPLTARTSVASYFYGLGALFRAMMFLGMMRCAFLTVKPPEMPITELPTGAFYSDSGRAFDILLQEMQSSGNGVLITRKSLEGFKPKFPVFWMTKVASGMIGENIIALSPTNIGILIDLVKRHLEKGHSLVVIDCFEYLMVENGFENAFKFLLSLKDTVVKYNGTLVVVIEPSAYSKKQMAMLMREFERLDI
ncbi:DUF835 domain-containing protein [Thermococcus pacificus]|uniref:DUF835 domain-containing protein n=1 Tax=Thermococcus pacificus TaxID=71998 RepID=A0A218P8Y7_9EURY|nr:DUF835 domain-containing protein [Thermococcus pacificus]ASJ07243.1 hypothetical protein A3L08_07875 [Thermococcus pacificus]